MFSNKKFLSVFLAQTILPWVVAGLGIIDVFLFDSMSDYYRQGLMDKYEHTQDIFVAFYRFTMVYGVLLILALLIIGVIAFIIMIKNSVSEGEKYSVARPLVIWLYGGLCILGTLILMFLAVAFTYGMSV